MLEPNFFIIGAPKCGTTALHAYLSTHPQVFMSTLKEPHHYAVDLPGCCGFPERRDYLSVFAGATQEHVFRGESSVYYLYSQVALERIVREHPAAKFVALVRNPIELAYSLHAQHLASLNEDVPDFAEAWSLQEARAAGQRIPASSWEPQLLQYRDVARLGSQLARAMQRLSPQQLRVLVFDDFRREPARIYAEVLDHLELPHDGRTEFPAVNANKTLRWRWMAHLLNYRRFPVALRRAGRVLGLHYVQLALKKWNHRVAPRPPLPASLRRELAAVFADDVHQMSELLRRDLSNW